MLWVAWWLRGCRHTTVKGISFEGWNVLSLAGLLFVVLLVDWGYRLNPDVKSWLQPQPVLSLVGLVVGFLLLGWQLDRQYENTLAGNRQQAQDRLKLDLYGRIAERIEATSVPLVEAGGLPTVFVGELAVRSSIWSLRPSELPPQSVSFERIQPQAQAASQSITALMSILESHALVLPGFAVFGRTLADALRAVSVAVGDFNQAALPFAGSEQSGPAQWPPTYDHTQELKRLADAAMRASFQCSAVVSDLRVAAQNYLLGGLFGRKVPLRTPADPTFAVTRIDPDTVDPRGPTAK